MTAHQMRERPQIKIISDIGLRCHGCGKGVPRLAIIQIDPGPIRICPGCVDKLSEALAKGSKMVKALAPSHASEIRVESGP